MSRCIRGGNVSELSHNAKMTNVIPKYLENNFIPEIVKNLAQKI